MIIGVKNSCLRQKIIIYLQLNTQFFKLILTKCQAFNWKVIKTKKLQGGIAGSSTGLCCLSAFRANDVVLKAPLLMWDDSMWWLVLFACLHELLLGALGADDILGIGDEAPANQRCLAQSADEALVVPVTVFKRDEACATDSWKTNDCYYFIIHYKRKMNIFRLWITR